MSHTITLVSRQSLGRQAKKERAAGRIPCVVYGHGIATVPISVGRSEFLKHLRRQGASSLIDAKFVDGTFAKLLVKEMQHDPITSDLIHVDFYQVKMDEKLIATVPLSFTGESPAVKIDGGTLVKSLDEIEVQCFPKDLPQAIDVDLGILKTFDDVLSIGMLKLPQDVRAMTEKDVIIATVARPLTEEEIQHMESTSPLDLSAIKTEGEEKKEAEGAKRSQEEGERLER